MCMWVYWMYKRRRRRRILHQWGGMVFIVTWNMQCIGRRGGSDAAVRVRVWRCRRRRRWGGRWLECARLVLALLLVLVRLEELVKKTAGHCVLSAVFCVLCSACCVRTVHYPLRTQPFLFPPFMPALPFFLPLFLLQWVGHLREFLSFHNPR